MSKDLYIYIFLLVRSVYIFNHNIHQYISSNAWLHGLKVVNPVALIYKFMFVVSIIINLLLYSKILLKLIKT